MTFEAWAQCHGIESARRWFKVGDHLVLTVTPGKYVTGTCGKWHGSEPLGDIRRNPTPQIAMARLRKGLCYCFKSEEVIYNG